MATTNYTEQPQQLTPLQPVAVPAGAAPPQPEAQPCPPGATTAPTYAAQPQTVPAAQPVAQPTVLVQPAAPPPPETKPDAQGQPELIIYSHSPLFYWWPVWVVGYAMALVTYLQGQVHPIGEVGVRFHPNQNVGVVFTVTLFLVILITNVTLRGLASAIVLLLFIIFTLVAALYDWWDPILTWLGQLHIYLNMQFYLIFATLTLLAWLSAVFVFDRMNYWRVRPGQVTQEYVFGAAAKSYDTENLVLEKFRDDLFRHWVLGFGSGDLHLRPYGANRDDILIPNVLFVGAKVEAIQRLIATQPQGFDKVTVR